MGSAGSLSWARSPRPRSRGTSSRICFPSDCSRSLFLANKAFHPATARSETRRAKVAKFKIVIIVVSDLDSAEKPYECFDEAQHERKISNDFTRSSVRPFD